MKGCPLRFWLFNGSALFCLLFSTKTAAQIVPDTTLPNNSVVIPQENTSIIEGGTQAGSNLFHSFQEFSVLTGGTVFFNNALDIQNILSRVTGTSISNIDGLIRANGTANLFLLNPNGIIFGPHAQLNIGGSFLATTASSIKFADGTFFGTTNSQTVPLLTISVPVGLQMGPNPGNTLVQGSGNNLSSDLETGAIIRDNRPVGLQVAPGRTLVLLGGNVALEGGNLTAEGGRIELGSVGGGTLVTLTLMNQGMALSYPEVANFQDINLSKAASVDATGAGGGDVFVVGRRVTLIDGSAILAFTEGAASGGTLSVRASELLEAIGTVPNGQFPSGLFAAVAPGASGDGGDLTIDTTRLRVADGAQVATGTFGSGKAGNLTVKATDTVEVIGNSGIFAQVTPRATGDGGNLTIETARLRLVNGGQIGTGTFGSGKAGDLTVKASDTVEVIGTSTNFPSGLFASVESRPGGDAATGNGGNLTIETARLRVADGAQVFTGTFGSGNAGNLTIKATDTVEVKASGTIINKDMLPRLLPSSLGASVEPRPEGEAATGDAGNVTIDTAHLRVDDGAKVSVRSSGEGKAGNLIVNAGFILLENASSLTADTKAGGGSIEVSSPSITLRRGSSISTNATGGESGGDIFVGSQFLQLREGSSITTNAEGIITGTQIKGGNMTIDADILAALENSDISANSDNFLGGQIQIAAQGIFGTQFRDQQTSESDITASSQAGAQFSGTVTINTPDVDPSSGLVQLPETLVDAGNQIAKGCTTTGVNQLAVTGRGGLPPNPSEALSNNTVWLDFVTPTGSQQQRRGETRSLRPQNETLNSEIVEAQGWVINSKGEVILTAEAARVTPHHLARSAHTCQPVF